MTPEQARAAWAATVRWIVERHFSAVIPMPVNDNEP